MNDAEVKQNPLVLIVDDDPFIRMALGQALEEFGYRVVEAENGTAGIEMFHRHRPDLVLLDVVMPDLNGYQATRKLARNRVTGHIPVVLASSKAEQSDRVWGLRQGAKDYIVKPVKENVLLQHVNAVLGD